MALNSTFPPHRFIEIRSHPFRLHCPNCHLRTLGTLVLGQENIRIGILPKMKPTFLSGC